MTDDLDLTLPDFLDRRKNGIVHEHIPGLKRADHNGIVWTKKRNWRKIEARRRKAEGKIFKDYMFTQRRGQ